MKVLHVMVGLPRSGKSTAALRLGHPIVSPDAIRLAMHGTAWRPESEPLVWGIAKTMAQALFLAGHDEVTVDACHHTAERRLFWEDSAWVMKYHVIGTPERVCAKRAVEGGRLDLLPVISRMAAAWDAPCMGEDC